MKVRILMFLLTLAQIYGQTAKITTIGNWKFQQLLFGDQMPNAGQLINGRRLADLGSLHCNPSGTLCLVWLVFQDGYKGLYKIFPNDGRIQEVLNKDSIDPATGRNYEIGLPFSVSDDLRASFNSLYDDVYLINQDNSIVALLRWGDNIPGIGSVSYGNGGFFTKDSTRILGYCIADSFWAVDYKIEQGSIIPINRVRNIGDQYLAFGNTTGTNNVYGFLNKLVRGQVSPESVPARQALDGKFEVTLLDTKPLKYPYEFYASYDIFTGEKDYGFSYKQNAANDNGLLTVAAKQPPDHFRPDIVFCNKDVGCYVVMPSIRKGQETSPVWTQSFIAISGRGEMAIETLEMKFDVFDPRDPQNPEWKSKNIYTTTTRDGFYSGLPEPVVRYSDHLFDKSDLSYVGGGYNINISPQISNDGRIFFEHKNDLQSSLVVATRINTITHGASFLPGPLAPRSFFTIFGKDLGSFGQAGAEYLTRLGGLEVSMCGLPVRLYYNSGPQNTTPGTEPTWQVNASVPSSLIPGQTCQIKANINGEVKDLGPVNIVEQNFAPFSFDQLGVKTVLLTKSSGSRICDPAVPGCAAPKPGEIITMWGTGGGQTAPTTDDRVASPGGVAEFNKKPVILLDSIPLYFTYAGRAPGFAALDQINIYLPDDAQEGAHVLSIVEAGEKTDFQIWVAKAL